MLVGLTLATQHHRILGDLDQLLLLGLFLAQGKIVWRQELGMHGSGFGGNNGQAEDQQESGAEAQGRVHRWLRQRGSAAL
ncbi:hypothetical protein D3C80_1537910 [compost metagenome]